MPKIFNLQIEGWAWQPDKCPADLQFMEWLFERGTGNTVFHMGTGIHHNVGLTCVDRGIACLGITASREEYLTAPVSDLYQVMLADIYQLDTRLLPNFSVMTLFHLGEMVDKFGGIHEPAINKLIHKVDKGGLVMFYTGSSAWDRTEKIVDHWRKDGVFKYVGQYKGLISYRV